MRYSPVLYLFPFLILLDYASSHSGHHSDHQCNALLRFSTSFTVNPKIRTAVYCNENHGRNIAPYPATTSWKQGTDCCTWHGITCDNMTGDVIKIHLTCSYFQGTLHSITNLFSLPSLQSLRIRGNRLTGHIPFSLCQKSSIKFLDLADNHLTGNIPHCLGNLSNLESLDFSYNRLGGPLPRSLANCTNLESLSIFTNEINGMFPLWLKTLPLYSLQLTDNNFHGQLVEPDSPAFPFPHLEYFLIGANSFSGPLPPTFLLNSSLTTIDLSGNYFEGGMPIPPATAEFFFILGNKFTGKIPHRICNSTNLHIISLSSNSLTGTIPQCLVNRNPHLVELDLRRNNFHGSIPEIIALDSSLKAMALSYNQLEGLLPRSLANCASLEVLDIGSNQIEDVFPSWLETLPNLYILALRSNKLHGPINPPRSINAFPKLHLLDLSNNDFHATFPTQYITNFRDMMGGEEGRGTLGYVAREWLMRLSASIVWKGADRDLFSVQKPFMAIDLSCNQFQGELPEVLGNLKSLIGLNFSHNNLTGHIPSSLGNLTNLEWLDLSGNNFTGAIPGALADLTYLAVLNLSNNQLQGPIPFSKQFASFTADSFGGNAGLCGLPLPRACGEGANKSASPTPHEVDDKDTEKGSWFEWRAVVLGYGCGIIVGISLAQIVLLIGRPRWLMNVIERVTYRLKNITRPRRTRGRGQPRRRTTR